MRVNTCPVRFSGGHIIKLSEKTYFMCFISLDIFGFNSRWTHSKDSFDILKICSKLFKENIKVLLLWTLHAFFFSSPLHFTPAARREERCAMDRSRGHPVPSLLLGLRCLELWHCHVGGHVLRRETLLGYGQPGCKCVWDRMVLSINLSSHFLSIPLPVSLSLLYLTLWMDSVSMPSLDLIKRKPRSHSIPESFCRG